ncbi:MAG: lipopolysaccharide biosynthesis protein [Bacteroidales bacterium]|nr:lipopolysaccharide biosynthesis protein [Bacteroidales bacterium]
MGIVFKQTLRGSIWSYLGVVIGALNVAILMPRIFSEEQIGLTSILVALSAIFAQFSTFGVGGITYYFFPLFRNPEKKHHYYFAFMSLIAVAGFLVFCIVYAFFHNEILTSKSDSALLDQYSFYILPLTFFTLMFAIFDGYNTVLYDAVSGTFYKEFLFRVLNTLIIILFFYKIIDFSFFLFLYIFILSLPAILLFFRLAVRGQVSFKILELSFFKKHRREFFFVALFSLISGFGSMLTIYIDKYLTNFYLGLAVTGIYTISSYIASVLQVPARSMTKILVPLIAQNWRNNVHDKLQEIYLNSSLAQFLISSFFFILIWINLDIVFLILPAQYAAGKYVILIMGLANIVNALGGSGSTILQISDSYKVSTYFIFALMLLTVLLDVLLIPVWGIVGAATGALFAAMGNVILRVIFLKRKYNLYTFDKNHLWGILIFAGCFLVFSSFDFTGQVIINGLIKTILISAIYALLLLKTDLLVNREFIKRLL